MQEIKGWHFRHKCYNTHMKKITYLLIILVIILIIAGYIYYVASTPVSAPTVGTVATSTATTTPTGGISTAGWTTYQSKDYSLQYPADFKEQTINGVNELTVPLKDYFSTVLTGEAYFTLNDASTTCPTVAGDGINSTSTLTTGAAVFTKENWSGVGAGQLYMGADYVTMKNGLCYDVSVFTHSANGAGLYYSDPAQIKSTDAQQAVDMQHFMSIADTIITTFQFTH